MKQPPNVVLPLPGGGARGPQGPLTWLFYHIQDRLSAGVFKVLESDDTVIFVLVGTIHCILAGVLWERGKDGRMKKWVNSWKMDHPQTPLIEFLRKYATLCLHRNPDSRQDV